MATGNTENLDNLLSCPVCLEHYRDPRGLSCLHQFCLVCLQQIVLTTRSGSKEITCPICCVVAPIPTGKDSKDLPKPVLMNEMQDLIKKMSGQIGIAPAEGAPKKDRSSKLCDLCETGQTKATRHCYECHDNLCDTCYDDHQKLKAFEQHNTVPINATQLYSEITFKVFD